MGSRFRRANASRCLDRQCWRCAAGGDADRSVVGQAAATHRGDRSARACLPASAGVGHNGGADGAGRLRAGDYDVDCARFRALVDQAYRVADPGAKAEALRLWRGPALVEFCYEPFAQSEIASLEELRLGALEDAIAAELAAGGHAVRMENEVQRAL